MKGALCSLLIGHHFNQLRASHVQLIFEVIDADGKAVMGTNGLPTGFIVQPGSTSRAVTPYVWLTSLDLLVSYRLAAGAAYS